MQDEKQEQTMPQENKMGVMPVGRLLITMSLPIMLSMLIQALYNVVDGLFVARIGEDALAAISLSFPVQNLIIAVGVGTAVGVNSLLSRRLGEKNFADANATAENGIFLAVMSWLVFAIFGFFGVQAFFQMFTQETAIVQMGVDYLSICCIFSFGCLTGITTERIIQSTGKTIFCMLSQATGAVINIVLDPIMIFGWFGCPAMGIKGAAIATVIGQIAAMILALWFNARYNTEVKMRLREFRPNKRIIGEIYKVGVPSIIVQSIASVMTVGLNKILIAYSATAVSVLGAYFRMQSFVFMPVFGLTNGLVPIVAYNFGARKKERIKIAVRDGLLYALGIMLLGTLAFQVFPVQMLKLFQASDEMLEIGVPALRIISLCFASAAVGITFSSVFQAIGNGMLSLIMSVTRQLVLILPVAWLLGHFFGLHAIWYSFLIAEMGSLFMSIFFYRHAYRKQIAPLSEPVDLTKP